jgi:hypothetical protein
MSELAKHLIAAIEKRQNVGITYQGRQRLVTPYMLGENNTGYLVLQGYQYGGESSKGPIESPDKGGWRYFYLQDITSLAVGDGPEFPQGLAKNEDYAPPTFITAVLASRY